MLIDFEKGFCSNINFLCEKTEEFLAKEKNSESGNKEVSNASDPEAGDLNKTTSEKFDEENDEQNSIVLSDDDKDNPDSESSRNNVSF